MGFEGGGVLAVGFEEGGVKDAVLPSPVFYIVVRVQRQANLDRQSFKPKCDFSILFLRFLWIANLFWL